MKKFALAWVAIMGSAFLVLPNRTYALGNSVQSSGTASVVATVSIKPYYPPIFKISGLRYEQTNAQQAFGRFKITLLERGLTD